MKSFELLIKTDKTKEVIDITDEIKSLINKNKVEHGICHLFVTHTTAAITTADLDPGTDLDFLDFLEKIKPSINYRHPHNPNHAPDHILSSIIGASLSVPIQDGRMILGAWQRIILVELDGPRSRTILVSF